MMSTPNQEDYLEVIWRLTALKGYARVADIAEALHVSQASVSKMMRKLNEDGLLSVEKYRGLALTSKGAEEGKKLVERHHILEKFLRYLAVGDPETVWRDVEGIEHHFSPVTMDRLNLLITFIEEHPTWWQCFLQNSPASNP